MAHAATLDRKAPGSGALDLRDINVLDLGTLYPQGPGYLQGSAKRRSLLVLALCVLAALVVVAGAFARPYLFPAGDDGTVRVALEQQQFVDSLNVDDKAALLALGTDAAARNAAIPLSGGPVEHVSQFQLATSSQGAGAYPTALRCLTQAVYYEAATEPLQGRRAVAQVILNRMRHPAYPHSVCGVVYQGSERRTGCQFSFTCDGSLLRVPSAGPWREAEVIAREALAGRTEPSVGTATHYHADYVLPKWAFQLGKIDQIGRHIFYRFTGGWGKAAALNQAYAGREAIPALNFAALRERLEAGGEAAMLLPAEELVPGLTVPPAAYDRHAANDVGGRIDTTKEWRLTIPDPTTASSRYRAALGQTGGGEVPASGQAAAAVAPVPAAKDAAVAPAPAAKVAVAAPVAGHEVAVR